MGLFERGTVHPSGPQSNKPYVQMRIVNIPPGKVVTEWLGCEIIHSLANLIIKSDYLHAVFLGTNPTPIEISES